jgi:hypothetical protein
LLRQLGDIGRDPPRFIAAASAGINTAVLSQKRLERLMVGVPRYGSTQQYCLIFWLIACHELYGE